MADVFISYFTADRAKASLIGTKLMEQNISVWWDRNIILGEDYFDRIEAELEASRAVIVIWSKASVKSPWVKAEANRGANSNRLLPVIVENCTIPLRFEILQAADLRDWRGGADHQEWKKLLQQVRMLAPQANGTLGPAPTTRERGAADLDAVIRKAASRVVEFLSDPDTAGPKGLYSVFREFPEFTDAKTTDELWLGMQTKEALFKRLCQVEPRLTIWHNTGGAMLLRLSAAPEAEVEDDLTQAAPAAASPRPSSGLPAPTVEDVIKFAVDLLAASPIPIPLATVATAIEAEFGEGVRKSRWLGHKTLKNLLVQKGTGHGLQVGGATGYLFDSSRHTGQLK